jgi:uncharacterized protein YigA (DUF484 family)
MSAPVPKPDPARDLRAAVLADPALVLDDPDVMRALIAATDRAARNVVDLRGALVSRLEQRLEKLERAHRSVIAAAYENIAGAAQVQRTTLTLLEQSDAAGFLHALLADTPDVLAVDAARLAVEAPDALPEAPGVIALPEGAADAYLALSDADGRDGVWLRAAPAEAELLWGADAARVGSEALARIEIGGAAALLAYGAEDARRFTPDQGAELVVFLSGVVERVARRFAGG